MQNPLSDRNDLQKNLRVAPNGRYLEYTDKTPFFYLGDTAWELLHRLTREEAVKYLEDRARKGFTVIQSVVLAEIDGLTVPNAYGFLPLTDKDTSQPNEKYFEHVDYIIDYAGKLGLHIGLLPTWGKYWKTGDENIFTPEKAFTYGQFLGKRYSLQNIIWILGGDQNIINSEERSIIDSMAEGLRKGDGGRHLITFHPRGPGQSSRQLNDASWLDFHMSQSSHASYDHDTGLYADYDLSLSPIRPTLDGEPRYESVPVGFYLSDHDRLKRFDDFDIRQAGWWSVMAGACGHTYGDNNIWQMWQPGRTPAIGANIPWFEAIDHPGARQMGIMRRFMENIRFQTYIPDQKIIVDGPMHGVSKIRAMRAQDRSGVVVYSPAGAPFTIDQSTVKSPYVRQSWFDPRYGASYEFRLSPRAWEGQTFQTYTPPTSGRGQDWVLYLQAVDLDRDIATPIGN